MGSTENVTNMPDGGLILAVDGPSGTGKSTTCRALAKQLNAKYVDTGAMYRVATLAVLRADVDPADTAAVIEVTRDLPLEVSDDPDSTEVILAGEDVSREIRERDVTQNVSAVSAIPEVRAQRRYDQDVAAGREVDFDTVLADVIRRDELDSSRATSPLRPAEDAEIIDTSTMNKDEVLAALIALIERSA